jgi:hypothetical protein
MRWLRELLTLTARVCHGLFARNLGAADPRIDPWQEGGSRVIHISSRSSFATDAIAT